MFEDSTFETNGTIRTRSRNWIFAAFVFNGSILLALVLFPILFPQALPRPMITYLMDVPAMPHAPQQAHQPAQAAQATPNALVNPFTAPRTIPVSISIDNGPAALPNFLIPEHDPGPGVPGGAGPAVPGNTAPPIVNQEPTGPVRISTAVVEGLLLQKTAPPYPAIARVTRTQGTVILEAIISRTGAIENLHVVSGPPMLRQAAMDAVKTWRYRPYLLDGQPIEVETTVDVVFTLQ